VAAGVRTWGGGKCSVRERLVARRQCVTGALRLVVMTGHLPPSRTPASPNTAIADIYPRGKGVSMIVVLKSLKICKSRVWGRPILPPLDTPLPPVGVSSGGSCPGELS